MWHSMEVNIQTGKKTFEMYQNMKTQYKLSHVAKYKNKIIE